MKQAVEKLFKKQKPHDIDEKALVLSIICGLPKSHFYKAYRDHVEGLNIKPIVVEL